MQLPVSKAVTALFFLALLILSGMVIAPFFTPLVLGFVLAFVFYPLHTRMLRETRSWVSALLICILVVLIVAIPLTFAAQEVARDVSAFYTKTRENGISTTCTGGSTWCVYQNNIVTYLNSPSIQGYLREGANTILSAIGPSASGILLGIPLFVIKIVIMLFALFYFLHDGMAWLAMAKRLIPLRETHKEELFTHAKDVLSALLYGQVVTALIQGVLAGIGFLVFGVPNPFLWGSVTAFTALLPFFGAWIVWVPHAGALILSGLVANESGLVVQGVGLALYGAIIVSLSDNFIRAYVVSGKARVHPLLVFLGVFGGVIVFGLGGVIIGPLILSLFSAFSGTYLKEISE